VRTIGPFALDAEGADMAHARWKGTRRTLLTVGGGLFAARVGLGERAASAGRGWCRSDPVLLIDGVLADLFSSAPLDDVPNVTGPTQIVVTTPNDVTISLAVPGLGFLHGEQVRFERSRKLDERPDGIELKIALLVPASEDFPVRVDFAPRVVGMLHPQSADGRANDWIQFQTKL
jgi:hypothetical protein